MQRFLTALFEPVDAASSEVFRIAFGLMMALSVVRFAAKGWIEQLYLQPEFFFPYWGMSWVKPPSDVGIYVLFAVIGLSAAFVAAGWAYRLAIVVFFSSFTYAELIDQTIYLNHYYLVSIVAGLMMLMPLGRSFRLGADAWGAGTVPAWVPWTLRAQLCIVYWFAGLAKLRPDWLIHAQPLTIWLEARSEMPLIGPLLGLDVTAHFMSIAGAAFDLMVPAALLWRRTRGFAYVAVLGFHAMTGALFNIGMFPWVMITATLVFFEPSWPRALARRLGLSSTGPPKVPAPTLKRRHAVLVTLLAVHFTVQLVLPLRGLLYPGNSCWHEQGYRFAWKVMLMEKVGMVEFRVFDPSSGRRWTISPDEELTRNQVAMMSTQPDMILVYAHHLKRRFAGRGMPGVEIRADAWASLNGRPSQRLIDPHVDLARERDTLAPKPWVIELRDDARPSS